MNQSDIEAFNKYQFEHQKVVVDHIVDHFSWGKHIAIRITANGYQWNSICIDNKEMFAKLMDLLSRVTLDDFDH